MPAKRKSRRARLNFAVGDHVDVAFKPTDLEWTKIEKAYGDAISADVREEVRWLVLKYFRLAPAESAAPFIDDAIKYLDCLEKAADQFWKLLHDPEEGAQTDVASYVRSQLDVGLRQCGYPTSHELVGIMGVTTLILQDKTRAHLKEQEGHGFTEGSSWEDLIYGLDTLFSNSKLTQKITRYDDPGEASPFVQFFHQLQLLFPPEFRRYGSTFASLTQAMLVARREIRKVVKAREGKNNLEGLQT